MSHIPLQPVQLRPIPWGQRDPVLAREVCERARELTPRFHYKPPPRIPAALGWSVVGVAALTTLKVAAGGA